MKRLAILLFLVAATATLAVAQSRINAANIINKINRGEAVRYDSVEIEGVLDLTHLNNRQRTESSDSRFGFGGSNDTYESHVEVPLSFTNCTFRDEVIACYHNDGEDDTFIAHFDENVQFSGCTFQNASEFKYSEFSEGADFRGAVFGEEANFKYAEFSKAPVFAQAVFEEDANFKYTEVDGEDFTTFLMKNQ
jgi:uncharacterized protein YjbI with pentapeptide repeats